MYVLGKMAASGLLWHTAGRVLTTHYGIEAIRSGLLWHTVSRVLTTEMVYKILNTLLLWHTVSRVLTTQELPEAIVTAYRRADAIILA